MQDLIVLGNLSKEVPPLLQTYKSGSPRESMFDYRELF